MRIVDANVLLYAVNTADPHHHDARRWFEDALNGREPVGLAWVPLLAFLRLSTKVGLFPHPLPTNAATSIVKDWLGAPAAVVVEATARHVGVIRELLGATGSGANLVNDAHLAALAVEHDAVIVSYDSDFSRFPGVRWESPTTA